MLLLLSVTKVPRAQLHIQGSPILGQDFGCPKYLSGQPAIFQTSLVTRARQVFFGGWEGVCCLVSVVQLSLLVSCDEGHITFEGTASPFLCAALIFQSKQSGESCEVEVVRWWVHGGWCLTTSSA